MNTVSVKASIKTTSPQRLKLHLYLATLWILIAVAMQPLLMTKEMSFIRHEGEMEAFNYLLGRPLIKRNGCFCELCIAFKNPYSCSLKRRGKMGAVPEGITVFVLVLLGKL